MQTITKVLTTGLFTVLVASGTALSADAQTLLDESFSSTEFDSDQHYAEISLPGWQIINDNDNAQFPKRWCVYNAGSDKDKNPEAFVDHSVYPSVKRKSSDYLITPVLDLNGKYAVTFTWSASAQALDHEQFDLRVRVIEDGQQPPSSDFIFSILDPEMVLASGVQPTDYGWYTVPWVGWAKNVSTLDLSPWQGKKVRVVFEYYCDGKDFINSISLDDVKVYAHEISEAADPQTSINEWNFGEVTVGSKTLSDVFTLTNAGKDKLRITGVDAPAGFSVLCSEDMNAVSLGRNESVQMQIMYDAQMTSAAQGNIVINTNGSDATIAVRATKKMLPDGYSFEGFESEDFPPAGWTATGDWRRHASPIEGYYAATTSANMGAQGQDLITPRLDGSAGSVTFEYNYYDFSNDESGLGCDNVVNVYFSKDGKATWQLLDSYDYNDPYNENIHKKFTCQTGGSDNCYFKVTYMPLEDWDTEYGPEISYFYFDSVILPPLYGADSTPTEPELVTPANGARDIYPRDIVLTWNPAQFAEGYRLYVGTDGAATDLVNGVDMQKATTYTIATADYAKTYNWRVEAYNAKGSTPSATRNFTTQPDKTVSSYPFTEGFEGTAFPPIGWRADADGLTKWSASDFNAYEGSKAAAVQAGDAGSHAALYSPEMIIPENREFYLTFYWADASGGVKVDPSGVRTNPSNGSNGRADFVCEVFADGKWNQVAFLSDPSDSDNMYWYRERVDLTPYAGKRIQIRWNRIIHDYFHSTTALLDKIAIEGKMNEKLSLNIDNWDAFVLNNGDKCSSESKFTLLNDGSAEATVAAVEFSGSHFSTTLKAGDKIASGSGIPFAMSYDAGTDAGTFNETMTVTTTGGATVTMNLTGVTEPNDVRFYSFEYDPYGSLQPKDFITIDRDKGAPIALAMVDYANKGLPQAFVVMNYQKADWSIPFPNTGIQTLVAFAGVNLDADDWIIRPNLRATANSNFSFWGRNYEHQDKMGFGLVFTQHTATILVSTADDPNDLTKYQEIESFLLSNPVDEEYSQYSADLSEYDGQRIHVAVRHSVNTDGLAAFFDDFRFEHFDFASGVSDITADNALTVSVNGNILSVSGTDSAVMSVFNAAGMSMVRAEGTSMNLSELPAGIYMLRVESAEGTATAKFIKR